MRAKIYQSGQYCNSVQFGRYDTTEQSTILFSIEDRDIPVAIVPHSMMIIFDNSGDPDYDKIGKELRENKS